MSTASPLPLPPATLAESDANRRKREVAARLLEHRTRRPRAIGQESLPLVERATPAPARTHRVADSVAARFAQRESYRDFLAQEAERSIRQAEAAAEVARRNAQAISEAQEELLGSIEGWTSREDHAGNTEVLTRATPAIALATSLMVASPSFAVLEDAASPAEQIDEQDTTANFCVDSLSLPEPAEPPVAIPGNLLEFPRQLIAARKARPRLAEGPLREETDAAPERAQLRIFEVDARTISTEPVVETPSPEWASIRLDSAIPPRELDGDAQVSFAIPIQSAPLSQRLMAAAVDGCCIITAFLLAVTAAAYTVPELPHGLPAVIAAAGTLLVLFLVYQLLFFTVCDATPGMRYARIGLCTFADENPSRREMRRRVLAVVLAAVPVGLGFVWACLDDERLGWHDRISRMYQRAY